MVLDTLHVLCAGAHLLPFALRPLGDFSCLLFWCRLSVIGLSTGIICAQLLTGVALNMNHTSGGCIPQQAEAQALNAKAPDPQLETEQGSRKTG